MTESNSFIDKQFFVLIVQDLKLTMLNRKLGTVACTGFFNSWDSIHPKNITAKQPFLALFLLKISLTIQDLRA
jgi:hypothetical protein